MCHTHTQTSQQQPSGVFIRRPRLISCPSVSDAIVDFSGGLLTVYGPNETASIFATYPSEYLTLGRSFLDQVRQFEYNLNTNQCK